jgi:hypothetical protein
MILRIVKYPFQNECLRSGHRKHITGLEASNDDAKLACRLFDPNKRVLKACFRRTCDDVAEPCRKPGVPENGPGTPEKRSGAMRRLLKGLLLNASFPTHACNNCKEP